MRFLFLLALCAGALSAPGCSALRVSTGHPLTPHRHAARSISLQFSKEIR